MADDTFARGMKNRRLISITVIGRRSGREITRPVWFVLQGTSVWLLPVFGSKTQWYLNLKANRAITVHVGKESRRLQARLRKDKSAIREVIQRFRDKYTAAEIKRWYTGLDAAVQVPIAPRAWP